MSLNFSTENPTFHSIMSPQLSVLVLAKESVLDSIAVIKTQQTVRMIKGVARMV